MDAGNQHSRLGTFAVTVMQLLKNFIQINLVEIDGFQCALAPVMEVELEIFAIFVIPNQINNFAQFFAAHPWITVAIHPDFQRQMAEPILHCLINRCVGCSRENP